MNRKFTGGIIEPNSFRLIINKLELYIENEEKIIFNIKKSLELLNNNYIGNNNQKVLNKKNNINNSLRTLLDNRKKYIIYLKKILNDYITMDENTSTNFQKKYIN